MHVILHKAPMLRLDTCYVPVLNTYIVHDLNGMDAYTLYTVYGQDLLVAGHDSTHFSDYLMRACVFT